MANYSELIDPEGSFRLRKELRSWCSEVLTAKQ